MYTREADSSRERGEKSIEKKNVDKCLTEQGFRKHRRGKRRKRRRHEDK